MAARKVTIINRLPFKKIRVVHQRNVLLSSVAEMTWQRNGECQKGSGFRRPAAKWKIGDSGKQNRSRYPEYDNDMVAVFSDSQLRPLVQDTVWSPRNWYVNSTPGGCFNHVAKEIRASDFSRCSSMRFTRMNERLSVKKDFPSIPPENTIRKLLAKLSQMAVRDGFPYCVLIEEECYDAATLERCLHFHHLKGMLREIETEDDWLLKIQRSIEQPAGSTSVDTEAAARLISIIQDKPEDSSWASINVKELSSLVGCRWLYDSIIEAITHLINRQSVNAFALYLNWQESVAHLASKIQEQFPIEPPQKIIIGMNVGFDEGKTFVGQSDSGKGIQTGCHFAFGVYMKNTNVFHYGDSLGWPIPGDLLSSVEELLLNVYEDYTPRTCQINAVHHNDSNFHGQMNSSAFQHKCNTKCWMYYPLQQDSHICGISTVISMCLVALDDLAFLSLNGMQGGGDVGYHYLKNISRFNDFLRVAIIKWILDSEINLNAICSNDFRTSQLAYSNDSIHTSTQAVAKNETMRDASVSGEKITFPKVPKANVHTDSASRNAESCFQILGRTIRTVSGDNSDTGLPNSTNVPKHSHITIFDIEETLIPNEFIEEFGGGKPICSNCTIKAKHFHCMICPFSLKFPNFVRASRHIEQVHFNSKKTVEIENFVIVPCKLAHTHTPTAKRDVYHYHCPYCTSTVQRRSRFFIHLNKHNNPSDKKSSIQPKAHQVNDIANRQTLIADNARKTINHPLTSSGATRSNKTNISTVVNGAGAGERVACDICNKKMHQKSIGRHMKDKHQTSASFKAVCCDAILGLYMVRKSENGGVGYPIHVQKILHGTDSKKIDCEHQPCRDQMSIASRSGMTGRECRHLLQVNDASFPPAVELQETNLHEMAGSNRFKVLTNETIQKCIEVNSLSAFNNASPAVEFDDGNFIHLSIFDGRYLNFPVRSRRVVSFNKVDGRLTCKCMSGTWFCIHKAVALWYLNQTEKLGEHVMASAESEDCCPTTECDGDHTIQITVKGESKIIYPPQNIEAVLSVIRYLQERKRIPFTAPRELKNVPSDNIPNVLKPVETHCHNCHRELSLPMRITSRAKILRMDKLIDGVETFVSYCKICKNFYRYQEYRDGVHNFNDVFLLGLDVCAFLRECLKNHVAVGTLCSILTGTHDINIDQHTIMNAYNHFESLSERTYNYNCIECGFFPIILIADVNRKVAFKYRSTDEELPDEYFEDADSVNCPLFWDKAEKCILAKGFRGRLFPELEVKPKLAFWSPFIGAKSRQGPIVFNSEHRKVNRTSGEPDIECKELTEERLLNTILEGKLRDIQDIAETVGISTKGTKLDIVNRLKRTLNNDDQFNKVFKKMFGSSGGWLTFACVHGIIYAAKFLLRAESPRDYVDIMRSFKHRPNIFINDMAHMVARHANKNNMTLFSPFQGRVAADISENIELAKHDALQVSLPWLENRSLSRRHSPPEQGHPITGSEQYLALFDRFHESNSSNEKECLRKLICVKELSGQINSEIAEQIHGMYDLNMNFMNHMSPLTHIFMFRSIIDLKNEEINAKKIRKHEKETKLTIAFDQYGRAIFSQNCIGSESAHISTPQDSKPMNTDTAKKLTAGVAANEIQLHLAYDNISQSDFPSQRDNDKELQELQLSPGVCNQLHRQQSPHIERCGTNSLIDMENICISKESSTTVIENSDEVVNDNKEQFRVDSNDVTEDCLDSFFEEDKLEFDAMGKCEMNKEVDNCWIEELSLTTFEKNVLESDCQLTVQIINACMKILQIEYKLVCGLQNLTSNTIFTENQHPFIQIIPITPIKCNSSHWGVLSNKFAKIGHVIIYDSATRIHYKSILREVRYNMSLDNYAAMLLATRGKSITLEVADVKTINRNRDSGVAAIFQALCLCRDVDPRVVNFNYKSLRKRLPSILQNRTFSQVRFTETPRQYKGMLYEFSVPLYCTCNMPDDGKTMICCESCQKWFHIKCIKVPTLAGNWLCNTCTEKCRSKLRSNRKGNSSSATRPSNPRNYRKRRTVLSKVNSTPKMPKLCKKDTEGPDKGKASLREKYPQFFEYVDIINSEADKIMIDESKLSQYLKEQHKNGYFTGLVQEYLDKDLPPITFESVMNAADDSDQPDLQNIHTTMSDGCEDSLTTVMEFILDAFPLKFSMESKSMNKIRFLIARIMKEFLTEQHCVQSTSSQ